MVAVPTQLKRIPMSREEFDCLPEGPPYYDYVNGEAVELNRPSAKHQDILVCLTFALRQHIRAGDLGMVAADIDVALPTGIIFAPDIMFLSKDRLDQYDAIKGDVHGSPDLIVEIHSYSTMAYDRLEKTAFCHQAHVDWIWFVEQESLSIEEFHWTPEGYLLIGGAGPGKVFHPHLFPDLAIDIKQLMGIM
jgi:Uma2 family endonuclease